MDTQPTLAGGTMNRVRSCQRCAQLGFLQCKYRRSGSVPHQQHLSPSSVGPKDACLEHNRLINTLAKQLPLWLFDDALIRLQVIMVSAKICSTSSVTLTYNMVERGGSLLSHGPSLYGLLVSFWRL